MDLFEFKKLKELPSDINPKEFKSFLNNIWQKYQEEKPAYWRENLQDIETDEDIKKKQQFLFFEDNKVKSKNYVGYIKYNNHEFNLYPKICEPNYDNEGNLKNKKQINNMLRLWLKYSNNTILPNIESDLEEIENIDFIDILIYLFAKYTSDLLSVSIYQHYEEISEETNFLKGKLNFTEYIKNCACGKEHKFHCTYDSFEINNKFNQIIKYVSKCLYEITKNNDNKNCLQEIIYTLNDVEDVICTYNDCESVYINRFMGDFNTVLDYCKLFLQNSITFNESGDFNNFTFLLRTELLFEDFISNLFKKHYDNINGCKIYPQSQMNLDENSHFNIKPDLIIKKDNKIVKIIDIKYKDVSSYKKVSQADIYQCISYATRLGCNDLTLLYPSFNEKRELPQIDIKNTGITIHFKYINCNCKDTIEEIEKDIVSQLKEFTAD